MPEAATEEAFQEGQLVDWVSREGGNFDGSGATTVTRPVTFLKQLNDTDAQVQFGPGFGSDMQKPRLMVVPIGELHRQTPREIDPRFKLPPPRPIGTPDPDAEQRRREALRDGLQKRDKARELVKLAEAPANRAQRALTAAQTALRSARDAERVERDAFTAALRKGDAPPVNGHRNGVDRGMLRQTVENAEASLAVFQQELRLARARVEEADLAVRDEASGVVAAVVDREADQLRVLLKEADRLKGILAAAMAWSPSGDTHGQFRPLPVHQSTTVLLTAPQAEAPGSWEYRANLDAERRKPFENLLSRLVAGDPDADLEAIQ
jgi:hypothetical protein